MRVLGLVLKLVGGRSIGGCGGRGRLPEGGKGPDEAAGQSRRGGLVAVGHREKVEREAGREQPAVELAGRVGGLCDDEYVTDGAVT